MNNKHMAKKLAGEMGSSPRATGGSEQLNAKPSHSNADDLTSALRSSYQKTIDEGVPDMFMDLINKLK